MYINLNVCIYFYFIYMYDYINIYYTSLLYNDTAFLFVIVSAAFLIVKSTDSIFGSSVHIICI